MLALPAGAVLTFTQAAPAVMTHEVWRGEKRRKVLGRAQRRGRSGTSDTEPSNTRGNPAGMESWKLRVAAARASRALGRTPSAVVRVASTIASRQDSVKLRETTGLAWSFSASMDETTRGFPTPTPSPQLPPLFNTWLSPRSSAGMTINPKVAWPRADESNGKKKKKKTRATGGGQENETLLQSALPCPALPDLEPGGHEYETLPTLVSPSPPTQAP